MPDERPAPCLDLRTLTRGDGLLGMRAAPGFGPRGAQLTVVRLHGVPSAEQSAALQASGLLPLPHKAVQWRDPRAGAPFSGLLSLPEEAQFADFWAEPNSDRPPPPPGSRKSLQCGSDRNRYAVRPT